MMIRKRYQWKLQDREIQLGERTLIMGVLNVTPDSFSDGGRYLDPDLAYARALELEDQGADIIDIGAESTRPGSQRLNEEEELKRLVPVLRRLAGNLAVPVSVDTYKSGVAARALELGAEIINDPSALTFDPALPKIILQHDAGFILNHMRGTPDTWAKLPPLHDVVGTVAHDLEACVRKCQLARIPNERLVLDPGIGFGKRGEQNSELLGKLGILSKLGFPLAVGPSRKQFLNQRTEEGKLMGTAAAVTAAILMGAHIVRVHDVRQMRVVVETADAILRASIPLPRREQTEESTRRTERRPPQQRPSQKRPPQQRPPQQRPAQEVPPKERPPQPRPPQQRPPERLSRRPPQPRDASGAGTEGRRGSRAGRPRDGGSSYRKPDKAGRPFRRRDDRSGRGPAGPRRPSSPKPKSRPPKSPPEESGE